jgi:hypothetical protein
MASPKDEHIVVNVLAEVAIFLEDRNFRNVASIVSFIAE